MFEISTAKFIYKQSFMQNYESLGSERPNLSIFRQDFEETYCHI